MEETELIRVTFQGTEMFFRLGGALIKDALKFIKFFITVVPQYNRWKINRDTEKMKNEMTKAEYDIIKNRQKIHEGGMQYEAFIKAFGSEERTIINIADTSADRFYDLAKSHRLTYTLLPDLNLADGVFQIMVPSSQSDIFKVIIDRLTEEELRKNGERVETLKEEIRLMERESAEAEETLAELKKEGKTDTEEYKSAEEKIKETETAILEKETEMELLMGTVSGEITSEEYMATNEFAFNHQELFNEMMEKGVELHSCGLKEGLLKVTREQPSAVQQKNLSRIYFANPNCPEIAVRMEKEPEGYRCSIIKNGEDSGKKYRLEKNAQPSAVRSFTRTVEREIIKISDADVTEWVRLDSEDDFRDFMKLADRNIQDKGESAKQIEEKIPQAKERLAEESLKIAENEKQLIEIPGKNLLILPEEISDSYTLFSDNMQYVAELPRYKVSKGRDDKMVLILEKDEAIDFKKRRVDGKAGSITSQKSLSEFLSEKTGEVQEHHQLQNKLPEKRR